MTIHLQMERLSRVMQATYILYKYWRNTYYGSMYAAMSYILSPDLFPFTPTER